VEEGKNGRPELGNLPRPSTDEVEVAVSSAVAKLEEPLHFDAMSAQDASEHIAVLVGLAPLRSPSTEGRGALS
jgi:hypothetical protein